MPVMDVGKMLMFVYQRLVLMMVGMRFLAVPWKVMAVLMMRVMDMCMRVRHTDMYMKVGMFFGQVQPDACSHQDGSDPEYRRRDFAQHQN